MTALLEIRNLHATAGDRPILSGVNLTVQPGELHAIMGPNGSGKSTLAHALAGRETVRITQGSILYQGRDLLPLPPEDRARQGIFLAFQYPVEIPGVGNTQFLRAALNAIRKSRGQKEADLREFMALVRQKMKLLRFDETLLTRSLNEGFSGGEKKRNEILQMAILEPTLAILDETDSGLDIDALRTVADGINTMKSPQRAVIVVTHYQRLLNYVVPDHVHVLLGGRIVKSGDRTLALVLEKKGYGAFGEAGQRVAPVGA